MTGSSNALESALSGRYRIERELGGGGMSRVFLATERPSARSGLMALMTTSRPSAVSRTQDGAGASGTLTSVGSAIGTPAYMAPEQVAGDPPAGHRADLYAWGVVAWELRTPGARP
jgi:serine/threonine protein kinase